jgi:transcriptional regulator with XRE-family HTH domain
MKTAEREQARRLRREEGRSVKELAALLGVSQSTISVWVRDVELSDEQRAALRWRMGGRIEGPRASARRALDRRRAEQAAGRETARRGDLMHAAGCMLYWAEGARERNAIRFTNSDPEMVRFFVSFLRASFGVANDRIVLTCNLFSDHEERRKAVEDHWLSLTGLPRSCLRKSTVNHYSKYSQKKRRNKLPWGTCRVAVYDTRLVQHIYGAIQEYAGFERDEWLM